MALRAGAIRFNTDSSQMEIYDGNQWTGILATSAELETGGDTAILGRIGNDSVNTDKVDKVNMSTTGNGVDYADLTVSRQGQNGVHGSRTLAVFSGGYNPSSFLTNTDYVTIASGGDATAGGALTVARRGQGACASNQTRGLHIGGYQGPAHADVLVNTIDYITFSEKSAAVDFGDLVNKFERSGSFASATRAIHCGGKDPSNTSTHIDYVEISTLGNTADFGTLSEQRALNDSGSNAVRGIICGDGYSGTNTVTYVTIATLGNDIDFGDLTTTSEGRKAAASKTRIISCGGRVSPTPAGSDTIDYAQIMTTGNFVDFGNLSATSFTGGGTTNSHGGL